MGCDGSPWWSSQRVDGARTWSAMPVFGHLANAHRAAETVVVFGGEAAVSADVAARAVLAVSQR
jgi:hypothetical protein